MVSILIGIGLLITNWLTNFLLASREFRMLNFANFISALASLISLFLVPIFGLYGAFFCMLLQPIVFICILFYNSKMIRPTKFVLDLSQVKYVLSFGFIPYLSGIFYLAFQQIERWGVLYFLNKESLGKMYLVFLLSSLWVLIPNSINNLFFPKAVNFFAKGFKLDFLNVIKKYSQILLFYSFFGALLIFAFFLSIIDFVFPIHAQYINLVYIAIPGLILRIMCDPLALFFNSIAKLKPVLLSDVISTICYLILVLIMVFTKKMTLENIIFSYVLYNFSKFMYLLISYLFSKRQIYHEKFY
jgi:O-antigen/teichoic acid export membrane protein